MKVFYLVRHAKSSWDDPTLSDHDRPLNDRGERDAPFMAKKFREKGYRVDRFISSTANRAFSTARRFAAAFGLVPDDIEQDRKLYHASPETVLRKIRETDADTGSIAIFTHNPGITQFVNWFNEGIIDNVPTCGIARIESQADQWKDVSRENSELTDFMYPKQYSI